MDSNQNVRIPPRWLHENLCARIKHASCMLNYVRVCDCRRYVCVHKICVGCELLSGSCICTRGGLPVDREMNTNDIFLSF